MAFDMARFVARFLEEAREHIERLNAGLVRLEKDPGDSETLNAIFRAAHTVKGSSRMLKFIPIAEMAHKIEDVLGALRDGKIRHSKGLADLLFRGIDTLEGMINMIAEGKELVPDTSSLGDDLTKAAEKGVDEAQPAQKMVSPETLKKEEKTNTPAGAGESTETAGKDGIEEGLKQKVSGTVRINAEKLDDLIRLMGEIVSTHHRFKQRLSDIREVERAAKKHLALLDSYSGGPSTDGSHQNAVFSAHAAYMKAKKLLSDARDDENIQELLTDEFQTKAIMMRMVPLSTIFDSLHRMVRDLAGSLGREVDLVIDGGDIELDKKMVEKIGDPLMHLLRNALDHGIEGIEERRAQGKPARGRISVSAWYDAGSVALAIADDGQGISLDKIRERAVKKKMYSEKEVKAMPETALIDLIFEPGFSTSRIITDISGRGVGMDVVKRDIIDELRGTVHVSSEPGKGASFFLRLPITLAIMRILLISAADMIIGLTAHYVREIVRVTEDELIPVVNKRAIRLREEFIPVANLESILRLAARDGKKKSDLLVIIVQTGNEKLGLIVDALLDEEDMILKPLPNHMRKIALVSGITISGRNEIINVLHVPELIRVSKELKDIQGQRTTSEEEKKKLRILVVDDSLNTREIEKSILESHGYVVELAGDGIEAFEMAGKSTYDLVITDVEMPRMDGFSLTERLRADQGYESTPIIIVTSREKEDDKRRGIAVGADAYIVKGDFDQSNLLDTIRNLAG